MNRRAYSTIEIKSAQDIGGKRTFTGIASTPSVDRMSDIVEPMGMQIKLPCPLLWQHDSDEPIGWITAAKATKTGINVECEVANVTEPGTLKDRLDEAWQSLKIGLVRGLSIGFNPLESARIENTYGYRFLSWEMLELSCVTVPANQDCQINTIKSIDQQQRRAASGAQGGSAVVHLKSPPGVSGTQTKPAKSGFFFAQNKGNEMNIAQQIASFEAKRAASADRMSAIMTKSADEGRTLDESETQEYDALQGEVKSVDEHLVRLKAHEASIVAKATPITREVGGDQKSASSVRGGVEVGNGSIRVGTNLEKGIPFTRYVKALAMAKGSLTGALAIAENNQGWRDTSPEVATVLKAAVAAGDTTTAGWASELVYNENLVSAFLEYLRPQTIIGKMAGMTRVPFNVRWGSQTSGSTGYWVGQGSPVPVSKYATGSGSLGIAKAAGLIVLDQELIRSSAPSAEILTRDELSAAIAQFLDVNFIAPDYAAVANVNPASITNGVDPIAATGTTSAFLRADVQTLFATWINANLNPAGGCWVMTPSLALSISLMLNALGQPVFPGMTINGGTFFGLPVIVSNNAQQVGSPVAGEGHLLVLCHCPSIAMADDGQITIDASSEASIQMLDNPTNASTGGTTATTMVSMFQTNSVALRATRFINWTKRRSAAVAYIKDAAYVS